MKETIEIPVNFKISLTISMKNQIISFMDYHKGYIDIYHSEDDLLDSLFFYWVRNSSRKDYKWIQQKNIIGFLNTYSPLLKNRLKVLLNEINN
ncbi:hypothetical protein MZM54_04405 [[Brevibacterium] frigoritolerans]|nr:hypothetical protein [Peribacillus frigoritolerans]